MFMKSAIATFLLVVTLGTTCAFAQEGGGSGPPRPNSIIVITPVPTPVPATGTKLVQPKFR
jgi:hypothetical protein